jgi:hypothetical protein
MDSHYEVDVTRLNHIINSYDVLMIRFDLIEKRLLIDLRSHHLAGPMVAVVDGARSLEERMRLIQDLRPDFPPPSGVRILRWPRYIRSLKTLGVWSQLLHRCRTAGYDLIDDELETVYDQLLAEERETMKAVIRGEGYNTVWQRSA